MARLAALALAVLALAPAATAATADFTFSGTFGQASMRAEGALEGSQARLVRSFMDRSGNDDGTVTEEEAQRFVASAKSLIGNSIGDMVKGGNFTLDGVAPTSEIGDLTFQGAAGPVQNGGPISFQLTMTFLFAVGEQATHTLRFVGHPTFGGVLRTTLRVPDGWHVAAVEGLDGVAAGPGTREAAFDMPTEGEALAFTFAADGRRSPVPLPLALAAVSGALALRRRVAA